MSHRKFSGLLTTVLFFAWLASNAAAAEGLFVAGDPQFQPLQVTLRNEAVIGQEQIHRVYVTAGTNMFAFVVPETFRMDASNPTKVVLVPSDYTCFLAFRIIASTSDGTPPTGSYRELLLDEYPGAKILDEFPQPAGAGSGIAFDFQWTNSSQVHQSARAVFVSAKTGIVELALLSQPDKFAVSKRFFDCLRWSYCSDQEGPIKPIQTPKGPPRS